MPTLQQLNIAQPQPATMKLQAMKMGDQIKRTSLAERGVETQEHLLKMKQLEQGKQFIPSLTKEEFPKFKEWVSGLDPSLGSLLPDTAPDNFEDYKKQLYLGADNITKMGVEQYKQTINQIEKEKDRQNKLDVVKYKEENKLPTTAIAKFIKDNPNATPDEIAGFAQKLKGKGIRILPDGTVEIGGPADNMEKPTKTAIEKSLVGSMNQLLKLESIGNDVFKEALTFEGQAKNWLYKTKDYLGMELPKEQKEFLGKARVFIEDLEQYFNTYRKEITGAQAAIKELEMLRKSVLNKKLTPTQFEYSFNRIINVVKKDIRLKRMLRAEGFDGKDLNKKLEEIYSLGQDVPEEEVDRRGDELKASGLDDVQVVKQLKKEGYNLGE